MSLSHVPEILPNGIAMNSDSGIGEILFTSLPVSQTSSGNTTFNFDKIIKAEKKCKIFLQHVNNTIRVEYMSARENKYIFVFYSRITNFAYAFIVF